MSVRPTTADELGSADRGRYGQSSQPRVSRSSVPAFFDRPVLMLVTERMERSRLVTVVREAVAGGVNAVQLRNKSLSPYELLMTAAILRLYLDQTPVLVNGCASVARGANVSGVHLPERRRRLDVARRRIGPCGLVGRSVHSVESAVQASRAGADYIIAGTIFASASHPDREPAGVDFLRCVCASVEIPVIAIGGVTPENCGCCLSAGAAGVAVLRAILHAEDPRSAAARYWESLVAGTGE